ncbi:MAG TPA: FHA domain-containing serine/threonine-protein kinase [Isosphaeraceae bacterium]|nr:FHA domain-containing serine/threonine-protein kinase [Isosphaeraceae bacterium]
MEIVLRVTAGPHSGQQYVIDRRETYTVGRSSRARFPVNLDLMLSREHFKLESQLPLCHLIDLGSTNGTKVNGLRVERVLLREGDVIEAGDSSFSVHFAEGDTEAQNFATCAGCGGRIPIKFKAARSSTESAPSPDRKEVRLCGECEARRLKFPKTDPDYLIEQWIGGGGMGEVFRARQISRNRPVAIKMISGNSALGEKANGYFRREIEVLRDLLMPSGRIHPSIVAFYELYEIDSQYQLVMEYVDGKNALEWTRALERPLPIASAAQIGRHLLSALGYAHSKGYVHRDVKPSNLLVMGPIHRPRVKLSDFGLAKSFADSECFTPLTRPGDIGGSIGFISPDHIRDFSDVREPADIYSAGATLFYLLTNRYPYLGFDPRQPDSCQIILQHPPVPLRAFRTDAPEGLERVLLKALQKQPRDRWKSAQAMADALRPWLVPSS